MRNSRWAGLNTLSCRQIIAIHRIRKPMDVLEHWIAAAYLFVLEKEEGSVQLPEIETQFTTVGEYVFQLPEDSGFQAVLERLSEHCSIERHDDAQMIEDLLEHLLVFTVSPACELRQEFVQVIMGMNTESQQELMHVIQQHLLASASAAHEEEHENEQEGDLLDRVTDIRTPGEESIDLDDAASPVESTECCTETAVSDCPADFPTSSAVNSIINATVGHFEEQRPMLSGICLMCPEYQQRIDRLSTELQRLKDAHQSEVHRLKEQIADETTRVLDSEMQVMEREKTIFQLEAELAAQRDAHVEYDKALALVEEYKQQLQSLQDELDVARPKASKHDVLEGTVSKLREKLEELSEIRGQLREESAAHADTYHKLVELEREAEQLQKLPAQIESYRSEVAEFHIAVQEYRLQLAAKEVVIEQLRSSQSSLACDQEHRLAEHRSLVEQLHAASEELRERERGEGIGSGMCELNPQLMQELEKLRADNADLLSQLDRSSLESLDKLSKENADQKSVNASLQSKWMHNKDLLAKAVKDIEELTQQVKSWSTRHALLVEESREAAQMAHEELTMQAKISTRKIQHSAQQQRAIAALHSLGRTLLLDGCQEVLSSTESELRDRIARIEALDASLAASQEELHSTKVELEESNRQRVHDNEQHEQCVKRMRVDYENEVQLHESQAQQRLQQQEQIFQQKLQHEAARLIDMTATLEAEVTKKRKAERFRKMFETENQRYKMQLQAMNGEHAVASGGDYEIAMKELKSMQEQLDTAHQEIQKLKQQLSSSGSGSSHRNNGNTSALAIDEDLNNSSHSPSKDNHTTFITRSKAMRFVSTQGSSNDNGFAMTGGMAHKPTGAPQMTAFMEQAELNDKRIEQLSKEKRELLSRALEENKEKMEAQQRLTAMEKENMQLKAELRKTVLDKERIERKYLKIVDSTSSAGKENGRMATI